MHANYLFVEHPQQFLVLVQFYASPVLFPAFIGINRQYNISSSFQKQITQFCNKLLTLSQLQNISPLCDKYHTTQIEHTYLSSKYNHA